MRLPEAIKTEEGRRFGALGRLEGKIRQWRGEKIQKFGNGALLLAKQIGRVFLELGITDPGEFFPH